jgi:hypothetical protein
MIIAPAMAGPYMITYVKTNSGEIYAELLAPIPLYRMHWIVL